MPSTRSAVEEPFGEACVLGKLLRGDPPRNKLAEVIVSGRCGSRALSGCINCGVSGGTS